MRALQIADAQSHVKDLHPAAAAAGAGNGRHPKLPRLLHYPLHRLPAARAVPKPVPCHVRHELHH